MNFNDCAERMLIKLITILIVTLITGCTTLQPLEKGGASVDGQNISQPNIPAQLDDFPDLSRIDPIPETQSLMQQKKYAAADDYLSYFMTYDYVKDDVSAKELKDSIKDIRESWRYKRDEIVKGLVDGESDETEGKIAAEVSEFIGFGDIRDLGAEGKKYIRGQDVDKVNIALASFGIGATVGTVLTWGTSATVKPTVSFLKVINKAGKMPSWLGSFLVDTTKNLDQIKKVDQVKMLFTDIKTLHDKAGAQATMDLLSKSKNVDDFHVLAKFGSNFGQKTSTLLKIAGDDVIAVYQRNSKIPKEVFLEAATFGRDGIKGLNKKGLERFLNFVKMETAARRRMTNLEMSFIASGKRVNVLGRPFVKNDHLFDPKFIDATGRSNIERMKLGLAPTGKDGKSLDLHHMKQQNDGLLVEMSNTAHKECTDILHRYTKVSEIDRPAFNLQKAAYWKTRAKDFE